MCNIVYAHLVGPMDGKQREKFDDALNTDPEAEAELHRALQRVTGGG